MYLCVLSKLPYLHGYLIITERSEECLVIYYVCEVLAIVCATRVCGVKRKRWAVEYRSASLDRDNRRRPAYTVTDIQYLLYIYVRTGKHRSTVRVLFK